MTLESSQQSPGGSPEQRQDIADFLRRYQEDPNSISAAEAASRYRELISLASPDAAAEAHNQAFAQLPPEDRRTLAVRFQAAHDDPNSPFDGYQYDDPDQAAAPRTLGFMAQRAGQQDRGLLDSLFGEGSPLNSTLGKMAMAAAAAYLARKFLGGDTQQPGAQAGGGLDIGSILRALEAAQGGAQSGAPRGSAPQPGGGLDIGSILRALEAAQGGAQGGAPKGSTPQPGGGLDIGSILRALEAAQGGAPIGGAPQAGGGLDIGGILEALGGAQGGAQGGEQARARPDLSDLLRDPDAAQGRQGGEGARRSVRLSGDDDEPKKEG